MDLIYKETYKSYRQNLKYLIEDTDIKTKEQLSFLMAQRGFRKKKTGERLYPSEKQLYIAWEYVKEHAETIQHLEQIFFRTERYKRHTVKRVAVKEVTHKNKKYRKGQFLPKDYK